MSAKRIAPALLALALFALAGCQQEKGLLTGEASEVLASVLEKSEGILSEKGESFPPSLDTPISVENAQGMLGLTAKEFEDSVESAATSAAAIRTSAHEITVVKCKPGSAEEVRTLMRSGYDSMKWICTAPEESCLAVSGDYILLAVSKAVSCEAAVQAFYELAGVDGEADVFFMRE
jgi:hypothetical protein